MLFYYQGRWRPALISRGLVSAIISGVFQEIFSSFKDVKRRRLHSRTHISSLYFICWTYIVTTLLITCNLNFDLMLLLSVLMHLPSRKTLKEWRLQWRLFMSSAAHQRFPSLYYRRLLRWSLFPSTSLLHYCSLSRWTRDWTLYWQHKIVISSGILQGFT